MKKALFFILLLFCCQWALSQGKFFGGNDDGYAHIGFSDTLAGSCLPTTATLNVDVCDSYTLNAQTYTSSGSYTQTLQNVAGCDSILTLNLNLSFSSVYTLTASACDSYTLNAQTYSSSGTYTQTIQSAAGCDSVITLNLTLQTSTSAALTVDTCETYTLNGQTYTLSGTYIQNLTSAAGCDSTLTLTLTIDTVETEIGLILDGSLGTNPNANVAFQWLDCDNGYAAIPGATSYIFAPSAGGNYAVMVTHPQGCIDTSACMWAGLDVMEPNPSLAFSASPNPTAGNIQLDWVHVQDRMVITLTDILGKQVWTQAVVHSSTANLHLDVPSGLYLIWLQDESGRRGALKVLKE